MLSPLTRRAGPAVVAAFVGALLLSSCCRPAWAEEPPAEEPPADDAARALADEVLRRAGSGADDGLGAWTRTIIERALERAGDSARRTVPGPAGRSTAPLPAERHAGALAVGRPNPGSVSGAGTAELLIFTSLSVPAESWRQWAREAAKIGAPLVLRGVLEDGLRATVKEIGARLGGAEAGVAIDPRLFRLFDVNRVPAVVVVPGGVQPCESRGCADDPAPPHDRITGNIGLVAALEAVADEGAVARDAARGHLRRLRGEDRR